MRKKIFQEFKSSMKSARKSYEYDNLDMSIWYKGRADGLLFAFDILEPQQIIKNELGIDICPYCKSVDGLQNKLGKYNKFCGCCGTEIDLVL